MSTGNHYNPKAIASPESCGRTPSQKVSTGRPIRHSGNSGWAKRSDLWTEDEIRVLKLCIERGLSLDDIAKHPGILRSRKRASIRAKLNRLELRTIKPVNRFSTEDKEKALRLNAAGVSPCEMTRMQDGLPGRAPGTISSMLSKKRLLGPSSKKWGAEEDAKLKELKASGVSLPKIALNPSFAGVRSADAVRNRWHLIGKRNRRAANWTAEQESLLQQAINRCNSPRRIFKAGILQGRSQSAIRARAHIRGWNFRDPPVEWDKAEEQFALSSFHSGIPVSVIAADVLVIQGRSESDVRRFLIGQGLVTPEKDDSWVWSAGEIAILTEQIALRQSAAKIAESGLLPGRSKDAIKRKAGSLKLVNSLCRKPWRASEIAVLDRLLAEKRTYAQIAAGGEIPDRSEFSIGQFVARRKRIKKGASK
jgi:hypothetical protein